MSFLSLIHTQRVMEFAKEVQYIIGGKYSNLKLLFWEIQCKMHPFLRCKISLEIVPQTSLQDIPPHNIVHWHAEHQRQWEHYVIFGAPFSNDHCDLSISIYIFHYCPLIGVDGNPIRNNLKLYPKMLLCWIPNCESMVVRKEKQN